MSSPLPTAPPPPGTLTEYEKYIRVPELLALQKSVDSRTHVDELLFQSVHQVEELWMNVANDEVTRIVLSLDNDDLEAARNGLHRIYLIETLMSNQLRLLETMASVAYFEIRKGLGKGSGLESPGFNRLARNSKQVADAFERLCTRRSLTALDLLRDPSRDRNVFAIAEAMIDIDEGFQNFRYQHLALVKRIIGSGTPSLKGNPIELLERNVKREFFPELWKARTAMFEDFTPGELKT